MSASVLVISRGRAERRPESFRWLLVSITVALIAAIAAVAASPPVPGTAVATTAAVDV